MKMCGLVFICLSLGRRGRSHGGQTFSIRWRINGSDDEACFQPMDDGASVFHATTTILLKLMAQFYL